MASSVGCLLGVAACVGPQVEAPRDVAAVDAPQVDHVAPGVDAATTIDAPAPPDAADAAALDASPSGDAGGDAPAPSTLYRSLDFNAAPVGTSCRMAGFDDGAASSMVAATPSRDGSHVCCTTARPMSGNTFDFGGWINLPHLGAGDAIWIRVRTHWNDPGFSDASPKLKFLRVHMTRGGDQNNGYNDVYISPDGALSYIREGVDQWRDVDPSARVVTGVWETYEYYVRFGTTAARVDPTRGGQARLWKNGALVLEVNDLPTMLDADEYANEFLLFTYWNGEPRLPSAAHTVCVDDIAIATSADPPRGRDARGNPFIGP